MLRLALLVAATGLSSGCVFYEDHADNTDAAIYYWPPDAVPPDATPEPDDCEMQLPCPNAMPGRVTVCGRLFDVETNEQLRAVAPTYASCGSGLEATDGPCQLDIKFYDALDFAGNPNGAAELNVQSYRQDDCGRFVAQNIQRPSLGFLGIGVDDTTGAPDDHRLTGVAFPVTSGQIRSNEVVFALRTTTDDAWTTQASLGAQSFVDRGVILTLFTDELGNPVDGSMITSNGSTRPADDYYFSDTSPWTRSTVDPAQNTTGPNGASLMLGSALVEHSGTGGEPSDCAWGSSLAAAIPGVLFVQRTTLVDDTTGGACGP